MLTIVYRFGTVLEPRSHDRRPPLPGIPLDVKIAQLTRMYQQVYLSFILSASVACKCMNTSSSFQSSTDYDAIRVDHQKQADQSV